ncbi:sorting nexin-20 [Dendroctonus ponderosae]|uniref:PX domain-containing protein n=1 Tax=Dendroctonus ponderosae TaxID=77166 RepID=J3JU69_DENPD|nr:sorting nexin-20 [Dendroctonus ponderosae]AEE61744.1 unknown [Dendroctonus ponderosae]KAH1024352.1 hypothetical protein HUJ05_003845 [Dendroctonus ponderosae]
MTQIMNADKQGLIFEIISARISEKPEDKKYVIYTLQVRFISGNDDLTPSVIERRYTQFETLYTLLRKEFPTMFQDIAFPKKVLTGNFDNELITARSTAFEGILKRISQETKLRTSRAMQLFLQEPELSEAKQLLASHSYAAAYEGFQKIFKLLNKTFSDRSHAVILTLCRIVACCSECPTLEESLKWTKLALYRFDGVSDSDVLELYLPLLNASIKVYEGHKKNTEELSAQIEMFRKQGVRDVEGRELARAVNEVEAKLF